MDRCGNGGWCSRVTFTLRPPLERSQSEGRAKAWWMCSVGDVVSFYYYPQKAKIRVPLLRKESGIKAVPYDNNNNNRDAYPFTKIRKEVIILCNNIIRLLPLYSSPTLPLSLHAPPHGNSRVSPPRHYCPLRVFSA